MLGGSEGHRDRCYGDSGQLLLLHYDLLDVTAMCSHELILNALSLCNLEQLLLLLLKLELLCDLLLQLMMLDVGCILLLEIVGHLQAKERKFSIKYSLQIYITISNFKCAVSHDSLVAV